MNTRNPEERGAGLCACTPAGPLPGGGAVLQLRVPGEPGPAAAPLRTCLPCRPSSLSRRRRCASPRPRPGAAPDRLTPLPPPTSPHPCTAFPSRASFQKAPVHSPAFFERESRRFAASPEGGVYEADPYKYGAHGAYHAASPGGAHGHRRLVRGPHLPILRRALRGRGPMGDGRWAMGG